MNSFGKKVCENLPIKWVNFTFLHKFSKGMHCFLSKICTDGKHLPTSGRDGRHKFQVCSHHIVIDQWGNEKFLEHTSQSFGHKTGYIGFFVLIHCNILFFWYLIWFDTLVLWSHQIVFRQNISLYESHTQDQNIQISMELRSLLQLAWGKASKELVKFRKISLIRGGGRDSYFFVFFW